MNRTSELKRTGFKRKSGSSLGRGKKRRLSEEDREAALRFKMSVGWRPCAACRQPVVWALANRAHHVVYEQHCPVGTGWDTRNALPVCDDCHERHHNASRRIPLSALTEANREFASEVLGEAADDYLRRRYADR